MHELTEEVRSEENIVREYIDTASRGREHLLYSRHKVDSILIRRLNDEVSCMGRAMHMFLTVWFAYRYFRKKKKYRY